MGQCGAGFVCLGLLVLVFGQDFAASKGLSRVGRQMGPWRSRREEIGGSSDSGSYQEGFPYLPVNALAPGRVPQLPFPWFGSGGYPVWGPRPTLLSPPQDSPIRVQCRENKLLVTVDRDLQGNGKLVKASDFTLGPEFCRAGPQSTGTTVVFEIGLQECGNSLQMTPDWLIYGTNLTYNPTSGTQSTSITRTGAAVVPIQCYYPRYGNVSSEDILPTWVPFATTVSSDERLAFSLRLMTEDWSAPRSSLVFNLGDVFYVEASLEAQDHLPMILFVDSCVATASPDVNSNPRYEIIAYNGCLMDGTQEDSSSAFRAPRPQPDKLQFMVDAFRFIDSQASSLYITCSLRAAADTQTPDPMHKACSYIKASNSWSAVEGSGDICACCNTQNCAAPAGQSRGWGHSYRRPRGLGKREAPQGSWSVDRWALASVGPLLVLGEDQRRSLAVKGSSVVEMWVLVGVGCLSLVIVLACVISLGRSLKRKRSPLGVQK